MGKVSDNLNPKVILVEGTTPASPSAGQQKVFIDSSDHKLKRVNSSGTVTTIEGSTGNDVTFIEETTPSSPSAGSQKLFIDSADHKVKRVNSSGTVTTVEGAGSGGFGSFASYTPALTATTTNPTLGTGSSAVGDYAQDNKVVTGNFEVSFGTSGTAVGSGTYLVSLPVTADTTYPSRHVGFGQLYHSSTGQVILFAAAINSSTTMKLYYAGTNTLASSSTPWAWGASDLLFGAFTYRAA